MIEVGIVTYRIWPEKIFVCRPFWRPCCRFSWKKYYVVENNWVKKDFSAREDGYLDRNCLAAAVRRNYIGKYTFFKM